MHLKDTRRQKSRQLELPLSRTGEAQTGERSGEVSMATQANERSGSDDPLVMERVVAWDNVEASLKRVKRNKGSPGVDATVEQLPTYLIQTKHRWVVDVDLEKFFDRVNHDVLMGRLAKRIADTRILRLIRRYLTAGIMTEGVVVTGDAGTPQGGPLSPILANILLDDVDKELERRGHNFCRYADDLNVYVRSKRAGDDVMQTLQRLFGKLRLRINTSKSCVARPHERKFLGYSFWSRGNPTSSGASPHRPLAVMKERVRRITRRSRGRSMATVIAELRSYLMGWKAYFQLAETAHIFGKLDSWIQRRLRCLQLKHWKNAPTIYRELRARGLGEMQAWKVARNCYSRWRCARLEINIALPKRHFEALGLPRLGP